MGGGQEIVAYLVELAPIAMVRRVVDGVGIGLQRLSRLEGNVSDVPLQVVCAERPEHGRFVLLRINTLPV